MPVKALKPCNKIGCTSLTRDRYCDAHTVEKQDRAEQNRYYDRYKRDKRSTSFYKSSEWEKVRTEALVRDKYLCQHCLKSKKVKRAEMVDHIVPVKVEWNKRLTLSNLQSLCNPCHNKKTKLDDRKYKG
jgi:5-methylcytosine-specific restriction enzyme A